MKKFEHSSSRGILAILAALCILSGTVEAENIALPFNSELWELEDAEVVGRFDRPCLMGSATVRDLAFVDGIVETDLLITTQPGQKTYPGLLFRRVDDRNAERFYVRQHRSHFYPDVFQYVPIFNGLSGWQLYSGPGYSAPGSLPVGEWIHLRIEFSGTQARIFVGTAAEPSLRIPRLVRPPQAGTIGVLGPKDGTACFSSFSYRIDDSLNFPEPPEPEEVTNALLDWEISTPFLAEKLKDDPTYPHFYTIFGLDWQKARAEPNGLLDFARHVVPEAGGPGGILARTFLSSEGRQEVRIAFGYSDAIRLFFNGRHVFSGESSYRSRDPSFLGIVGLLDEVTLTLAPGLNEILVVVTESMGGWGIQFRSDRPLSGPRIDHSRLQKVWESEAELRTPESVVFDPGRELLYVSNFNLGFDPDAEEPSRYTGYVSKLDLTGRILQKEWIRHLKAPAGIVLEDDTLWAVERGALVEMDVEKGEIVRRYPIPDSDFLNDLVLGEEGSLYLTDTRPSNHSESRIYRFAQGRAELWEGGEEIRRANGLYRHGERLVVGNSGDGMLKTIHLDGRRIDRIVALGGGIQDGIRVTPEGSFLVSHWEGKIFLVGDGGQVVEIADLKAGRQNAADFEYIAERKLLIVPTFTGNRVVAYRLD